MSFSFANKLYRPIFDRLGVAAKLTLDSGVFETMPNGTPLIALDKTIGMALSEQNGLMLETVTPIAEFILSDLTALGITKDQVDGGLVKLNGKEWSILSHRMNPSHFGEADGTIFLMLEGDPND